MLMRCFRWLLTVLVAIALVAFFPRPLQALGTPTGARVRIVHASPDAPAVDILLNGQPVVRNLVFKGYAGYLPVKAGQYRLQIAPAGAGADRAVIDARVMVEPGRAYTIAAVGKLAHIKPVLFVDENVKTEARKGRLRAIHLSPDAPAVDVAVTGGPVLVEGLSFSQASPYLSVPAGSYNLELRPAGSMEAVLKVPNFRVDAGRIHTLIALGEPGNQTLTILPLVDTPAQ
jgi:hypothetical protein